MVFCIKDNIYFQCLFWKLRKKWQAKSWITFYDGWLPSVLVQNDSWLLLLNKGGYCGHKQVCACGLKRGHIFRRTHEEENCQTLFHAADCMTRYPMLLGGSNNLFKMPWRKGFKGWLHMLLPEAQKTPSILWPKRSHYSREQNVPMEGENCWSNWRSFHPHIFFLN